VHRDQVLHLALERLDVLVHAVLSFGLPILRPYCPAGCRTKANLGFHSDAGSARSKAVSRTAQRSKEWVRAEVLSPPS
jgi:hypothetical protein